MKKAGFKFFAWFLSAFALVVGARGDSLTNNFDVSRDYVANGIIGDTNWDGVYLRFGDIPGGNNGGDGIGNTTVANASVSFSGFLTVQSTATTWAAPGDDGFFLYKVVSGDFDAAVQVAAPFASPGFHLPGLLARAYNTNNSGAPYSATVTNSVENWMYIARFQEFAISEHVRYATNNADVDGYRNSPGDNNDTNTARYVRLTRVGNVFGFYEKTNQTDAWSLMGTLARPDLAGVSMQVGIEDGVGTTASPTTFFTDFELSGPNVTLGSPTLPGTPSGLVTTATNIGGSLTFSWTRGNPGDSSLVVMRLGGVIQQNPIQGVAYSVNAQNTFGDPTTRLGDANEYVVYNGTGTSVTVTNLAGNNLNYVVAVYEYTNTASPVYNTAGPSLTTNAGPGTITGVITSIAPTNIPVSGATLGTLLATFSSGAGTVDESAVATWTSSDPTIAYFTANVLTALTPGTVLVTGSFGGFSASATITVTVPAFTDNFGATQDYIASGVAGSAWDGLFLNYGDVPLTTAVDNRKGNDAAAGATSRFIAMTNVLTIEAAGSTWAVAGNDGPFLYKIVTGDFQATVHVGPQSTINNCDSGIMARIYNNAGGALQGGGGGAGGTETHINWVKVQNGTPAVRRTIDSGGTTIVNGLNATDRWFLMQRINSTNFIMFESSNPTNAGWSFVTSMVVAEAANNAPMEVGLLQEMRQAADGSVAMDSLMIDGPGITPPATPPAAATGFHAALNGDLSMTFNWVVPVVAGNAARSLLVMRAAGPVTALPTLAQAGSIGGTANPVNFGTGLNVGGGNYVDFSTAGGLPASATNTTATVKGLIPGVTYYAVVVTYIGSGGNKSFNNILPAANGTNVVDGTLISIQTLPPPTVPRGGIGQLQVLGLFTGGASVNVSPFASLTSGNTAIVGIANGVLTGFVNGTTTVKVIYGGFTNVVNVTVRDPRLTDDFSVAHDYLAADVAGTIYDGVYNPNGTDPTFFNPVPESSYVFPTPGPDGTTVADASISSNNFLTVTAAGDGWENGAAGGFFLFNYVPGDFQVAIHINSYDIAGFNMPGLLARAYSTGSGGTNLGAPFDLGISTNANAVVVSNAESFVSLCRFDEFGIGTYARLNLQDLVLQSTQPDQGDTNYWLLIIRSSGTNFNFYKRLTNSLPWQQLPLLTSYQVAKFANVPMQVGIMAEPWTGGGGVSRTATYDSYMLDYTTVPALQIAKSGSNIILSWPADPKLVLQSTPSLNPTNWQPVGGTPVLGPNGYTLSVVNSGNLFFRLKQ
jgi:hypothetical protein